jgi:hypothetical protein
MMWTPVGRVVKTKSIRPDSLSAFCQLLMGGMGTSVGRDNDPISLSFFFQGDSHHENLAFSVCVGCQHGRLFGGG